MRYNKTLGVAVAAILSGGIGLAANAAELTFDEGADIADANLTPWTGSFTEELVPIEVAFEDVDSNGSNPTRLPSSTSNNVQTIFQFKRDANIIYNVYIDYTLTGGVFNTNVNAPRFVNNDGNTNMPAVTRISGGQSEDDSVRFLLQAGKQNIRTDDDLATDLVASVDEDFLLFSFDVKDVKGLATSSGTIKLTASWGAADVVFESEGTDTATIYKSASGVKVDILPPTSIAQIDVTANSDKFIGGVDGSTTAITIGTVLINDSSIYTIDPAHVVTGTLVVKNGPFSASKENQVFLDLDSTGGKCVFNADTTDVAATIDGSDATFVLEKEHILLLATDNSENDICVTIDEDNATNIEEPEDKATGTLTLSYDSSGKEQSYSGNLAKIERNGTACTLYNVPHKQASDRGFYRFINKTNLDATVWATIKDREGVEHLKDQELGTVAANATLVINSDQLHDYAMLQGATTVDPWKGRAIMTINSDSTNMEAYGLLKGKNTGDVLLPKNAATPPEYVGPLVNVSLGASGNGCD